MKAIFLILLLASDGLQYRTRSAASPDKVIASLYSMTASLNILSARGAELNQRSLGGLST
ncbi:MAG: hypothetical protein EB071_04240 [Gammaproteobacteria bacterium]|nr:hypothetical protein [Gammaproteobacteria bacterium]